MALTLGGMPAVAHGQDLAAWEFGATGGVAAVQQIGGQLGVTIVRPLSDRLAVVGEGVWLQDAVTRRREEAATSLAKAVAQTQGKPTTLEVKAPAGYLGGGIRYYLTPAGSLRPYAIGTVGGARTTFRPTLAVGGADVTSKAGENGVTLGSDLAGRASGAAFSGGIGATMRQGEAWLVDVNVQVTSLRSSGSTATNVIRLGVGVSRRF